MAGSPWPFNPPAIPYTASQRLNKLIPFAVADVSGTSSATDATSLTDAASGGWVVNAYAGKTVYSDGTAGVISSNTATVLTVASWTGGTPTAVKTYMISDAGNNGGIGTVNCLQSAGQVIIRQIIPYVPSPLASVNSTATLSLGLANKSATFFLAATTVTGFNAAVFWVSTTPEQYGLLLPAGLQNVLITTATTVTVTIAVEEIISGASIGFNVFWDPISPGATLT